MVIMSCPSFINWNISFKCNFRCLHCYSRSDKEIPELDTDKCMVIVDKLAKANIFEVNIGGGECLLRDDIFEIMAALNYRGIKVDLSSNGWLIDKDVSKKLSVCNVSQVYLSLDHCNADIHDFIRNRSGAFGALENAIHYLSDNCVPFSFTTVIMRQNWKDLKDIYLFVSSTDAIEWNLKKYRPIGNGLINSRELQLLEDENKEAMDYIRAISSEEKRIRISFLYSDYPIPYISEGCTCGKTSLAIRPGGQILMCAYGERVLGNIMTDDIADIWRNDDYLKENRINHKCEAMKIDLD